MHSRDPYAANGAKRKRRGGEFFDILAGIPEVKAAAIVSTEGLPIALAFPREVDETRIAAMTTALLSLSERAIIEMKKGDLDQLYIKGSDGYLLILQAGPNAALVVSADKDVRLGLILLDCRRVCEKIAQRNFNDGDEDRYPYPFIFKPPEPPGDLGVETQPQIKKSIDKKPENKIYCQYCGKKLTKDEQASHNCRKRP